MQRYDEFRRAYEQARTELAQLPNVVGVGHGPKVTDGKPTDEYAIIAFVDRKMPLADIPVAERVPAQYRGWVTDVAVPVLGGAYEHGGEGHVQGSEEPQHDHGAHDEHDDHPAEAPDADPHHHSHDSMFLDWGKLHARGVPSAPRVEPVEAPRTQPAASAATPHVAVIADDGGLVMPDGRVDFIAAFKRFKAQYGDVNDFVSFFLDTASGIPDMGTFHSGIYNQTRGINYYRGDNVDDRRAWDSRSLQAFHSFSFITMGALLQEMGHMWGGYVTIKRSADDPDFHFDLLIGDNRGDINQVAHWGRYFNNDNSPMDYDGIKWTDNGSGSFALTRVGDGEYEFCDLDLYLMGLLPPAQARPFFVLANRGSESMGLIAAQRLELSVQNVIWAHGPRTPASGQTAFRQAFVVLTKDAGGAPAFAQTVDSWRQQYEAAFARATRGLASVDTRLAPAPPPAAPNPFASFFGALADWFRRLIGRS